MFDIFTKSRADMPSGSRPPSIAQSRGLNDAWRIAHAIEDALKAAETERRIFTSRVTDAVSRSAVSLGNGTDEYLERESLDSYHLDLFDTEIHDRNKYLVRLDQDIDHLKLLARSLLHGFPELDQTSAKSR
jgi:hypothetical protein